MKGIEPYYDRNYSDVEHDRKHALKAAKELCYSKNVIERLKAAVTSAEISNIMHDARKGKIT